MTASYNNKKIGKGIYFSEVYDKKFKTNLLTVRFVSKLDEKISPMISLLVDILGTSNKNIKSRNELNQTLISLYDSNLKIFSYPFGDYLVAGMSVNFIGDKYTLDDDKISVDAVKILLDCIFNPDIENDMFNDKYFNQSKQDLIEAIKSEINDRHGYANLRANSFIYKDEPASVYENGTVEFVEKIQNKELYPIYQSLLKDSYVDISIVGEQPIPEIENMISKSFGNIDRTDDISIDYWCPSPVKAEPMEVVERCDVNQCKMFMAFKTDNNDLYAQKVMCAMFGGTSFSKLFTNVREKMSLCYYCQANIGNIGECKGTMTVDSGIDKENIEKAKDEIIKQLESIAKGDFTDEMLENTKKALYNGFSSNYDSVLMLNSWYFIQRARNTNYSPDEVNKIVSEISRERVVNVAKSFKLDTVYVLEPEV